MTIEQAADVVAYLEAVCVPLMDRGHRLQIVHQPGAFNEYVFQVRVPGPQVGFVVGHKGETAEAVRRLARARSRIGGFRGRVDVRIVAA